MTIAQPILEQYPDLSESQRHIILQPEPGICKECDTRFYCSCDGVIR